MLPDGCLLHLGRRDARLKSGATASRPARSRPRSCPIPGVREAAVGQGRGGGGRAPDRLGRGGPGSGAAAGAARGAAGLHAAGGLRIRRVAAHADGEGGPRGAAGARDGPPRPRRGIPRTHGRGRGGGGRGICARARPRSRRRATTISSSSAAIRCPAVELLTVLGERLGKELSAADLLEAPTPSTLAARAPEASATPPRAAQLVRLSEGAGRPVFVIPGGGGDDEDLFAARRLARVAGGSRRFWPCARGRRRILPSTSSRAMCVREIRAAAPGPVRPRGRLHGRDPRVRDGAPAPRRGERVALLALLDTPFPANRPAAGAPGCAPALRGPTGCGRGSGTSPSASGITPASCAPCRAAASHISRRIGAGGSARLRSARGCPAPAGSRAPRVLPRIARRVEAAALRRRAQHPRVRAVGAARLRSGLGAARGGRPAADGRRRSCRVPPRARRRSRRDPLGMDRGGGANWRRALGER